MEKKRMLAAGGWASWQFLRGGTLKSFLLRGIVAVAVAFLLLAIGWLGTVTRLNSAKEGLFADAQALRISYQLEVAVREAKTSDVRDSTALRKEAARMLAEMPRYSTTPEEANLLSPITACFESWERGGSLSPLLQSIDAHRALNERQMQASMLQSAQLECALRWVVPLFMIAAMAILAMGSWTLWARIFGPTLKLSYAAERFGQGISWSPVSVAHEDEIGALCRTFNSMADTLREREQERLDFVAGVAHDLKTPLVVIGGVAHLLEREDVPPTERRKWLERMHRQVRVLDGLVEDFTDSVSAQTGRLHLQREALNLCALCRDLVQEQSVLPDGHRLRFEGEGVCPILGDRRRLERAVNNLLSNALKYGGEGEVTLSVWRRGAETMLSVRDQGEGLTSEEVARLFRPYARLDRHSGVNGTGLGLVSVQKIVEAHGGTIEVHSQPGRGTEFELRFKQHDHPHNYKGDTEDT